MTRLRILTVLATVTVVLAASQWGFASSITFVGSSTPGVYDYGLMLAPGETVDFDHGGTITLSGLSSVTGHRGQAVSASAFPESPSLHLQWSIQRR